MGYEIHIVVAYTLLSLLVGFAWVAGYLDKYQSRAQEVLLDKMGENKASYGLKSICQQSQMHLKIAEHRQIGTITGQRVTDDEDVNKLQDEVGKDAGGIVGKGGVGEGVGSTLSKGL